MVLFRLLLIAASVLLGKFIWGFRIFQFTNIRKPHGTYFGNVMRAAKLGAINYRKEAQPARLGWCIFGFALEQGIFFQSLEKSRIDSILHKGLRKYVLRDSYD